jgi:hypothetical protein
MYPALNQIILKPLTEIFLLDGGKLFKKFHNFLSMLFI